MMKVFNKKVRKQFSNSTSLNDLSFLLIVFFIVTASFFNYKGFNITVPQDTSDKKIENTILMVEIEQNGSIIYNEENITFTKLDNVFRELKDVSHVILVLKVHSKTKYQSIVDVIDCAKQNNIHNYSFTQQEEK